MCQHLQLQMHDGLRVSWGSWCWWVNQQSNSQKFIKIRSQSSFRHELVSYNLPLVVLNTKSIFSSYLWWTLGGGVWSWMKSNLFWFIEGQTHFSTSWHAKMRLTINDLLWKRSLFKPPHYHHSCTKKLTKHGRCCVQKKQLLTKRLVE